MIPPLKEYRCSCGKLLFKGSLVLSVVEVKCKRCGRIGVFREMGKNRNVSFSLSANKDGVLTEICQMAEILGLDRGYYIGKQLGELSMIFNDLPVGDIGITSKHGDGSVYLEEKFFNIPRHTLTLRDGAELEVNSFFTPYHRGDGAIDGYHIFNMLR